MTPPAVRLVLDFQPGRTGPEPDCALCGAPGEDVPVSYAVAVAGGGRICSDCVQGQAASPRLAYSAESLAAGLSEIASAVLWAADSPDLARGVLGQVLAAVRQLAEVYGLDEEPAP